MKYQAVFNCYKIATHPNLNVVADYFRIAGFNDQARYLLLQPDHLQTMLKKEATGQYAWLFNLGEVCLVNFDTADTYRLLKELEAIGIKTDFALFSTFNELHTVEYEPFREGAQLIPFLQIQALVMAKSVELKRLESVANTIFDQAEAFIIDLQKGIFHPNNPFIFQTNTAIVKLQMDIINNLKILDRPAYCSNDLFLKDVYDAAARDFELERRFENLQTKIANLNQFLEPYHQLSCKHRERQLYILEVILLALFPLFHLINHFLQRLF